MLEAIRIFLAVGVFFGLITSLVLWIWFGVRCYQGSARLRDLVPLRHQEPPFWTMAEFMIMFGAWILLGPLFLRQPAISNWIADHLLSGADDNLVGLVQRLFSVSAALFVAGVATVGWMFALQPKRMAQISWLPKWRELVFGAKAALWLLPPVGLISAAVAVLVPYQHDALDALKASPTVEAFVLIFIGTAIVAPIGEEVIFRALLQGGLQGFADRAFGAFNSLDDEGLAQDENATVQSDNPYQPPSESAAESESEGKQGGGDAWQPTAYWPVFVSSLLFAAMHLGQGAAPIPLFVLSLGLGMLYRQTGRITAPIVVHMILNALTLSLEFTRYLDQG